MEEILGVVVSVEVEDREGVDTVVHVPPSPPEVGEAVQDPPPPPPPTSFAEARRVTFPVPPGAEA